MQPDGVLDRRLRPADRIWWWLPPVIWPRKEDHWQRQVDLVLKAGGCNFVLNAPWQMAFFKSTRRLQLWAGPFCNLANPLAVKVLAGLGFSGAIVSPELGRGDYLLLARHSPLPLGMVISGHWPLCVTRLQTQSGSKAAPFVSPRGEEAWEQNHGENNWIFPNWPLNLRDHRETLVNAGYRLLVHLSEPVPAYVKLKPRPGLWNWDLDLA